MTNHILQNYNIYFIKLQIIFYKTVQNQRNAAGISLFQPHFFDYTYFILNPGND